MNLLTKVVERVSDHPVLFIFFRSLLENYFTAIRALIRSDLECGKGPRTLDLACGPGAGPVERSFYGFLFVVGRFGLLF